MHDNAPDQVRPRPRAGGVQLVAPAGAGGEIGIRPSDGVLCLIATGDWNVRNAAMLGQTIARKAIDALGDRAGVSPGALGQKSSRQGTSRLGAAGRSATNGPPASPASAEIDLSQVRHLDTAGVLILNRVLKSWQAAGYGVRVVGASTAQSVLIDEVSSYGDLTELPTPKPNSFLQLLEDAGRTVNGVWRDLIALTGFLGALTASIGGVIIRPSRFRAVSFVHHLEHVGLRAVPIIALICALIGAVVMQQGAVQLRPYGAEPYAVNMLAVLSLREVGVLLTAIMVAGRSGSAFTAEIGSMKMREEIDAMRTLGLDPIQVLVLPRILALMVALPLLTFVGDIMCLVGGGVIAVFYLGLEPLAYIERLQEAVSLRHFMVGMVKTPFAAMIIGLVGCIEGLKVAGSAESLGRHVTSAVVKAIFLVIVLDAFFAMFLSGIGY